MKTVMYLRKSRADAEAELRGEGETLARHEKILLDVAKRQKLHVEQIYREIVSGETIASRPVMQQLLSEVEQGLWEGVIVVEIERLARGDTIDQGIMAQAFKYSSTKIITPNKTYDPCNEFDEEYFEFGLFMSRREYKTINRRLQQGRMASVKEGKYVGNKPPYGYVRVPLERDKGFTLAPHPDEAPIVKMIFDLYTKGIEGERIGVALIARKLNNMKIPAQKGDWTNSTIQTMLRNPVYIGKVRWNSRPQVKKIIDGQVVKERPRANPDNWILADGRHPAIIDLETFELANNYINTNRPRPNPSQCKTKNPLSGIVTCAMCGRKMIRRPYACRNQQDTLMCPQASCKNISSKLNIIEEAILKLLKIWATEHEAEINQQTTAIIDVELLKQQLKNIEVENENLGKQFDKTHDLLEQGIYDTDTFLSRTKIISEKIKELQNTKESITNQINLIEEQEKARKNVIPTINDIINTYHSFEDPGKKNELLKKVLEKVTYLKTTKSTKDKLSPDVTLRLYPKIK